MTSEPRTHTPDPDELYRKALRLSGVLNAVAHLENAGECNEGRSALIFLAEELAEDLERSLDQYSIALHQAATRPSGRSASKSKI